MERHLLAIPSVELRDNVRTSSVEPRPRQGLLAAVFERASTRSRVATAAAARRFGLQYLELPWTSFYGNPSVHPRSPRNVRAEVRSLAELGVRALVVRVEDDRLLEAMADDSPIPLVSAATRSWHPLQGLADLRAVHAAWPGDQVVRIAFLGNGQGPVVSSLLTTVAGGRVRVTVVSPAGYGPRSDVMAAAESGAVFHTTDLGALEGVDAVYTDEWFYRPATPEEERAFLRYALTRELLDCYAPDARVLHCLPHADEVQRELLFGSRSLVWEQVRQRTAALVAVLECLLGEDGAAGR